MPNPRRDYEDRPPTGHTGRRPQSSASPAALSVHARYSRLAVVIASRLPNGNTTQAASDGSNPQQQMHRPNIPSVIPRSALPIGPSTRREPPITGPTMPATSLEIVSTTTAPTEDAVNGATNAKDNKSPTPDTTSPTSFRTPPRRLFC